MWARHAGDHCASRRPRSRSTRVPRRMPPSAGSRWGRHPLRPCTMPGDLRFLRIDANHPVVRATLGADIPPGALLRRCPSPPPPAAAGASGALPLPLPPPSPAAGLLLPLRHTKSVRQPAWAPAARHRPRRVHNRRRPAARPARHLHPRRSNLCIALREERRRARPGPIRV